jgi:hypothetical protein
VHFAHGYVLLAVILIINQPGIFMQPGLFATLRRTRCRLNFGAWCSCIPALLFVSKKGLQALMPECPDHFLIVWRSVALFKRHFWCGPPGKRTLITLLHYDQTSPQDYFAAPTLVVREYQKPAPLILLCQIRLPRV